MVNISEYFKFIKTRGRKVSEINSGSEEIALSIKDALEAIELLKELQIPILGGDILSEDSKGKLIYAYQLWGQKYHSLNWYCDKVDSESQTNYVDRSYLFAKNSILIASEIARNLQNKCYMVLVI